MQEKTFMVFSAQKIFDFLVIQNLKYYYLKEGILDLWTKEKMANEQKPVAPQDSINSLLVEFGTRLNEVEEKQRIARDRIILLGKNVIETRGEIDDEAFKIKERLTNIEEEIKKMKQLNKRIINEFGNFARKSELNILERQYKIFEPLEFARISDVKEMIKEELDKIKK